MKLSGLKLYSSPFTRKVMELSPFLNQRSIQTENKSYIAKYFFINDSYYLFICDYQLHLIKA